jgi:LysR family transcriptional regulator, regulator of abg operon
VKYHQLKVLVSVVESGSFRGAARRLHLTQPAITKAIKELETQLGLQLFVRQAHGAVLTSGGQVLFERSRIIVNEMQRARDDIAHLKGLGGGRLAVGVTPLAGLTILPKAFERFRDTWPDVEVQFIEFTSEQMLERLRSGSLDLAISAALKGTEEASFPGEELFSLPTSLAVNRASPLAAIRSLAELQHAEWIHTDITRKFPMFLSDLFVREGLLPPKRVTLCTSQALFHSLAMQNNVVFFWSLLAIGMPELRTRFVALPITEDLPLLSMNLLTRSSGPTTKPTEHFIRCIREVSKEDWDFH